VSKLIAILQGLYFQTVLYSILTLFTCARFVSYPCAVDLIFVSIILNWRYLYMKDKADVEKNDYVVIKYVNTVGIG
jgi:hypothetical protein